MRDRLRAGVAARPAGLCECTAAAAAILAGLYLSTTPANALCAPDPASSGQTVTCSGNDADGFQAGAGVNTLTVNVLPGATVNDNGTAAISVNDFSVVTNGGSVTAANFLTGINIGSFNTVTNNATITVGSDGFGIAGFDSNTIANHATITAGARGIAISIGDNNVVTNSGTLAVGSGGTGIFAGQNNTITNAATGSITVVDRGSGIFVGGNSTVTNAGSIVTGFATGPAAGIFAINDNNTIFNAAGATISVGDNAAGIFVQGNAAAISNAGSINVTANAVGIAAQGDGAVITNSGRITGGDSSEGIVVSGASNTIVNRGTITVGNNAFATGIDVSNFASGTNTIVNTGTITVGTGATGILVTGPGTVFNVFNSGTINAASGFAAIDFCNCGAGNVLTLGPGSVINGFVFGTGSDTFQLGGSGKDTFNLSLIGAGNQYDGFSTFNKVDSSNWTVIGTGAQDWNVLGGTLTVNGAINGVVTVNAGGTLAGTGSVGDTAINTGGILQPGNGIPGSSLTVAGNLAFQSGALYLVQLNSVTSTFANVTGSAALAGSVGASFLPGSTVMRKYPILTAALGHTGGFAGAAVTGAPALVATLSYDPTHAFINFALDFGVTPGLNVNQRNVGNALTNFFNASGGIPFAFASLSPAGLTQVSGELATGTQQATFDAMSLFLGLLTDPFIDGRGGSSSPGTGATPFAAEGAGAYAANKPNTARDAFAKFPTKADVARNDLLDPHWSVWGAAFGGGSSSDGNAVLGSNSSTARAFGFAAGADYRISPATLVGFALAGGGTNFAVNGFGTGRSDLFQAGAFVRHNVGAAYISAAAAYGWQNVTTDRTVTTAGIDRLHAQFNANAYSGRLEGGYRFVTPWMGITPYAAGQFTTYSLPAYAESVLAGTNTFALNYAARDVTASRSELGVRTDKSYPMPNGILTLRGRVAWAHDFNTDRNITPVFQTLPGAAFIVNGAAQAPDSALTTASAEMKWLNGWSAAGTFEGQFADITRSYAGKGVVRYTW